MGQKRERTWKSLSGLTSLLWLLLVLYSPCRPGKDSGEGKNKNLPPSDPCAIVPTAHLQLLKTRKQKKVEGILSETVRDSNSSPFL